MTELKNNTNNDDIIKWVETLKIELVEVMEAVKSVAGKFTLSQIARVPDRFKREKITSTQYPNEEKYSRIEEVSEYYKVKNNICESIHWPIIIELEWKKYFKNNEFLWEVKEEFWLTYIVYDILKQNYIVVSFEWWEFDKHLLTNIDSIEKTDIDNWWKVKSLNRGWYYYISDEWKTKYMDGWNRFGQLYKHWNIVYFSLDLDLEWSSLIVSDWIDDKYLKRWHHAEEIQLSNWKNILFVKGSIVNINVSDQKSTVIDADLFEVILQEEKWISIDKETNIIKYNIEEPGKIYWTNTIEKQIDLN